jgi:hypothetical protein
MCGGRDIQKIILKTGGKSRKERKEGGDKDLTQKHRKKRGKHSGEN